MGPFIDRNTDWRDVVFSPHAEVPEKPEEWLSYTMKRIYRVRSVDHMYQQLHGLRGDFVADIFVVDAYKDSIPKDLLALMAKADSVKREGPLALYKFSRSTLLRLAGSRPGSTKD